MFRKKNFQYLDIFRLSINEKIIRFYIANFLYVFNIDSIVDENLNDFNV